EGRARTQFDAKPLLQALPPSALRLQIVRGLAQLTESTPAEIETLFELAQPVAKARVAPPRAKRTAPVGLEPQITRLLVAHAEMLAQLVTAARELGTHAVFATLAETLRASGPDFEPLIAEIAAEPETDLDAARLELAGAIRQSRMKALRDELEQLVAGGLADS